MHCQVAGSQSDVENKVLEANPLLEAFGNAKTLRNNNSGRFGKWVEIHFDIRSKIVSARMDNYLLEKSRLVRQQKNERNFHIFYQLFSDDKIKNKYKLSKPSDFYYMSQSGCINVPGIDDTREFDAALRALPPVRAVPVSPALLACCRRPRLWTPLFAAVAARLWLFLGDRARAQARWTDLSKQPSTI